MDLLSYLLAKGKGGVTPTGTINITENGTYDVTNYASAEVDIPSEPSLPNTYKKVNYVESSGTQYINTGYKVNANTKLQIKASQLRSASGYIFGAKEEDVQYILLSYAGKVAFYYNESPNRLVTNEPTGEYLFEDVIIDSSSFKVNGELHDNLTINLFPDYNLYLFCANTDGVAADFAKAKIGSVKISENDVLLHDLVPCYRISDSVIGFYDLVTDNFLTNSGTGTFTYLDNYL